ncbi:MAG: ABC transporter ATP-binding protein [Lachnospiraceae bacterium]|nr:ABC transporter ATP-binding protein [Lachnospiraceae bacterium]
MENIKDKNTLAPVMEIEGVTRVFHTPGGDFTALNDISFSVPEGVLAILKGHSGSGKTTLLNIIGALDTPTSGNVRIKGRSLRDMSEKEKDNIRRKRLGFVFQSVSLIPHLTAFQNVEFSLRLAGVKAGDRRARVEECLKMVGLLNRRDHMPAEMSGGEQQRVAIARAMAHRPEIILADEPTAELDSQMAAEVTRILKELTEKEGVTVIMTTHDVGLMEAGDIVVEMESGTLLRVTDNR